MKAPESVILFLLLILPLESFGAVSEPPSFVMVPVHYRILTDRSIYIAGETICFRVFYLNPDRSADLNLSTVYYLELISPNGLPQVQNKLALDKTGTKGSMRIPEEIPSGTYYLKGYTRWMRNSGAANFNYLSIEIVNPHRKSVLPVDTSANFSLIPELPESSQDRSFRLEHLSDIYQRRDSVEVYLSYRATGPVCRCCVSVSRLGALESQWQSNPSDIQLDWNPGDQLPETRGLTLTGQVRFTGTEIPAKYAIVYVSTIGSESSLQCNYTDSLGRFYFAFPGVYGERELFLSATHDDPRELEILVEQDFSTERILLPSYPLHFENGRENLLSELSINAQINERYESVTTGMDKDQDGNSSFFYSRPSAVIRIDDFIRLPVLKEYFTEVIPQVTFRNSPGSKKFRVLGDHPDLEFFPPLMLIDEVAIFDTDAILSVSPGYMERIEIVDAPYVVGNVTFGGIIHLITRNRDMGYIDLPSSGLLLDYLMLDEDQSGCVNQPPLNRNLPDTRNTLFWEPELVLGPDADKEILFMTGDTRGIYRITIRGYRDDGTSLQQSWEFEVR